MKEESCILLTSGNVLIAKGVVSQTSGEERLQIKVLDGEAELVAQHEIIHLIRSQTGKLPLQCQLREHRGDVVILEKMMELDQELRRNLRIPVRFHSFIYPIDGGWRGRKDIVSIDLSCGGIAFYASRGLEVGEIAEVVVPTAGNPVIVKIQILRKQELKEERTYYAAKFIDLLRDEDRLICEAVFSIQLKSRKRSSRTEELEGEEE